MVNATSHGQEILVAGGKSGAITVFSGREAMEIIDVDQIRLGSPIMSMSISLNLEEVRCIYYYLCQRKTVTENSPEGFSVNIEIACHISKFSIVSITAPQILTVTSEGSMLRVKTKQLAHTMLAQHPSGKMNHISFPFGSTDHFLTCSGDTNVTLWDLNDYTARVVCSGRSFPVPTCSVGSADIVVAGYEDETIRCFDTINGAGLWKV